MEEMLTYYVLNNYESLQDWNVLDAQSSRWYASKFIYDFMTNEFDKWVKDNRSGIYKKEVK